MMMMPISPTSKRYILAMTVAAIILAQLNFAVNIGISGGGANITDAGMMIVLARNVLLFVLFAYIIRISMDVWKKPRRAAYFEE